MVCKATPSIGKCANLEYFFSLIMSFRLQKTWQTIPKEKIELFDELARIFSEDNNQWTQRELLMKEGTAKFAGTVFTTLLVFDDVLTVDILQTL